ncbi:hypothetical protein [Bartonella kosoyi]|uniref:hypothetical protein n=1 Tax=Bartonella kosoyi TaxID=2133959 RepID=UPI001425833F|nr:hypothetical protein [Bartonella kosoyi]
MPKTPSLNTPLKQHSFFSYLFSPFTISLLYQFSRLAFETMKLPYMAGFASLD